MNKFKRIVLENKKIVKDRFYTNNNGKIIDINDYLNNMIDGTSSYFDIKMPKEISNNKIFKVSENTINLGTIDCILNLRKDGVKGNIVALNFANAMTPGGGYLKGHSAQEESLCRASMLYESLINQKDFYRYNKFNYTPIYNDNMIYSHNVPIIRNDNGEFLNVFELASFITSPAVNKTVAKFIKSNNKINNIMKIRIEKILSLALSKNPEVIVLGAFGCGVFGNKKEDILPMFEEAINKYVPFDDIKVIFAIRENIQK